MTWRGALFLRSELSLQLSSFIARSYTQKGQGEKSYALLEPGGSLMQDMELPAS